MFAEPDISLQRHSKVLCQVIHEAIGENGGWIGFDQYMQMALYEPGLGYYAAGAQKFGPDGDFITAPMLGHLFADSLADQCAEVLALDGCDSIVEFGAGNGDLAVRMLQTLASNGTLPDRYQIIETSADLRSRQQQRVQQLGVQLGEKVTARVEWLDSLPQNISGVVIGNELIDAMPFKRFEIAPHGQQNEMGVAVVDNRLVWQLGNPISPPLYLPACDAGYLSEWSPQAGAWINSVSARVTRGVILLIDYGFPDYEFYHPDRQQGTLMCHYRHHAHSDPFYWPGLQDITCHVDFSAIARAGLDAGMDLLGYNTQGEFLLASGLLTHLQKYMDEPSDRGEEGDVRKQIALAAEVKKLTLPHEMGELFKVIALGRGVDHPLSGFARSNKRHRLLND